MKKTFYRQKRREVQKIFPAKNVMTLKIPQHNYYGIILTVMRWSIEFWAPKTNLSGSP